MTEIEAQKTETPETETTETTEEKPAVSISIENVADRLDKLEAIIEELKPYKEKYEKTKQESDEKDEKIKKAVHAINKANEEKKTLSDELNRQRVLTASGRPVDETPNYVDFYTKAAMSALLSEGAEGAVAFTAEGAKQAENLIRSTIQRMYDDKVKRGY